MEIPGQGDCPFLFSHRLYFPKILKLIFYKLLILLMILTKIWNTRHTPLSETDI
jgi:hypothetical protein